MNTSIHKTGPQVIIYDSECLQTPDLKLFERQWWSEQGRLNGALGGRGQALLIDHEKGPMVLRQYLRGGWAAKFSRDRYFFTGFDQSRPLREFRLLRDLAAAGLAVPEPVAALCGRTGLVYRGAILMRRIEKSRTLAELFSSSELRDSDWAAVGACIAGFHRAGVLHADLNAANVLVNDEGQVHLVDFDRGRWMQGKGGIGIAPFAANISRLSRSMTKLVINGDPTALARGWTLLLNAYRKS